MLLRDHGRSDSASAMLLYSSGLTAAEINDDATLRTLRRMMIGASAGIWRRLSIRLRTFPIRLWLLVDDEVPQEDRTRCASEFLRLPDCCTGVFGQSLKAFCPDVSSLLSCRGTTVVKTWLRAMQWSIYSSEKEHASCRRLCAGDGPGRNFTIAARERVIECLRCIHVERVGFDPASVVPAAAQMTRGKNEMPAAMLLRGCPPALARCTKWCPRSRCRWSSVRPWRRLRDKGLAPDHLAAQPSPTMWELLCLLAVQAMAAAMAANRLVRLSPLPGALLEVKTALRPA